MPGSPAVAEMLSAPDRESIIRDSRAVTWHNVVVDGHRVNYAISGDGPPALFLHGWGLRPNGYREPIRRMGMAGCRVYAPAMPGFGGTPELPGEQRSFLSLIHISEPTRQAEISYAVFCLKKKKTK